MASASLKRDCQMVVSVSHRKDPLQRSKLRKANRKMDWPWSFSAVPSSGSDILSE